MNEQPSDTQQVWSQRWMVSLTCGEPEVEGFCKDRGWPRVREGWMDPDTKWEYKITWSCGSSVQFHYTEDDLAGARYIQTSARTVQGLAYPIQQAKEFLPVLDLPQLLEDATRADTSMEKGRALIHLGVSAPRPQDEQVFSFIKSGLQSPDETIRGMSIIAALYSLYGGFRPLLMSIQKSDPVRDLRTRAQSILAAFDNLGVSSE